MAPQAMAVELPAAAAAEVERLLGRIANSGCEFNRAGTWYSATEARQHLEMKFRHLVNRQALATTEDFIAMAATSSSMTGEAYAIRCPSVPPQASAVWLIAELRAMRSRSETPSRPSR